VGRDVSDGIRRNGRGREEDVIHADGFGVGRDFGRCVGGVVEGFGTGVGDVRLSGFGVNDRFR
jgi:hypothetical protein